MLTFTLDPRRWWPVCVFGRNPLLRGADRVEALIILFAIVVALATVPVAGTVGTAVYVARHQLYAQEAQARHLAARMPTRDNRTAAPDSNAQTKAAEASAVWVDNRGNQVDPPTPTSRAASDGIGAAAAVLLGVVAAATALVAVTHSRLSRMRDAQWEHELRCLANKDDGRNNRSYG
ncbi:hypothetical protein [Mycobacterium haemophilum]